MDISWTAADEQMGLSIAVTIALLIVLYHILFIVVDVRKVVRRVERITSEVESAVEKPLAMTEKMLTWVVHMLEGASASKRHGKKRSS